MTPPDTTPPCPAAADPVRLAHFVFPARRQKLPDGRWVITPGKPEMRARTLETVRITGLPSKTLHRLADCGLIRRDDHAEEKQGAGDPGAREELRDVRANLPWDAGVHPAAPWADKEGAGGRGGVHDQPW